MTGPLAKTMDVLAAFEAEEEALLVLAAALASSRVAICQAAATALVTRRGLRSCLTLVEGLEQLPDSVVDYLRTQTERLDPSLRQVLLQGSSEQRCLTLRAVERLSAVRQIPQLLELLNRKDATDQVEVAETLRSVVSRLADEGQDASGDESRRKLSTARIERALTDLEQAIVKYGDNLAGSEDVVESILILGKYQHPAVHRVLWQASPECRRVAGQILMASRHPGVIRLIWDSLHERYPHPKAFEAVKVRGDLEFLGALFRFFTGKPHPQLEQNLKQIELLAWLDPLEALLSILPQNLQPALLAFVWATRIPMERKQELQTWLLAHGGPAGRMAAAARAEQTQDGVIQEVLVGSLDSEDEQVQAWAVTQLRQHAVPEAFRLLLERLDSPSREVRRAVREELSDFNTERVLGLVALLDDSTALRVGRLLLKLDDNACVNLEHELQRSTRPRRLRAAQAICKLGLQQEVWRAALPLVEERDYQFRLAAAGILQSIQETEALIALEQLSHDPQPKVQEAAAAALAEWNERSLKDLDPLLSR